MAVSVNKKARKASKSSGERHANAPSAGRTPSADRLRRIRERLGSPDQPFTQKMLADKLGLEQPTVGRWETATKKNPYEPNPQMLLKFADFLAGYGESYDSDCQWLLSEARVVTPKILAVHDRARDRRIKQGVVALPIMDPLSEPMMVKAPGAVVELPAGLIRDPASVLCIATSSESGMPFVGPGLGQGDDPATDTFSLSQKLRADHPEIFTRAVWFPQRTGLVVVDKSITDLERLRHEELPVAIRYSQLRFATFLGCPSPSRVSKAESKFFMDVQTSQRGSA